eukprot:TRINITY_DN44438_c0_g1_i1.p1 TRINITY_DN44438_c0_g1~~TRINITY_DN44438_c0_g1_i1.p1  ORF type:complete len:325 (-),score=53.55 TRINITY_DN44438_c0_g1_i1:6-980(-)
MRLAAVRMPWWRFLPLLLHSASGAQPPCAVEGRGYKDPTLIPAPLTPNGAFLADAAACQMSCSIDPTCSYFTWYGNSHGCWLMGQGSTLAAERNAVSGPKVCPAKTEVSTTAPAALPSSTTAASEITAWGAHVSAGASDAPSRNSTSSLRESETASQAADADSPSQSGHLPAWVVFVAGALCIGGFLLLCFRSSGATCSWPCSFNSSTSQKKESARKRHMRNTRGMDAPPAVEEIEEVEPAGEKPLMPWEQRQKDLEAASASASNAPTWGFQAPASDGFQRIPLLEAGLPAQQAQSPGTSPLVSTMKYPSLGSGIVMPQMARMV